MQNYSQLRDLVLNATSPDGIRDKIMDYLIVCYKHDEDAETKIGAALRKYKNHWMIHYRTGVESDPGYLTYQQLLYSKRKEILEEHKLEFNVKPATRDPER